MSELLRDDTSDGFRKATEPREFRFPADHGPHPEYRNEWWYFTGNLDGEGGERFGFELTIFRFSLVPQMSLETGSAWQTNQVYIGHFAVTDTTQERFHVAQRYARGALGLAGAQADPFRVWLEDWTVRVAAGDAGQDEPPTWLLEAADREFALKLSLVPEKPVILNGDNGLSRKSAEAGNASYYYSISRLRATGRLMLGDEVFAVTGLSWLDREWGSSALSADQQGWDWFALQLSNGTELMFYVLRGRDGAPDEYSAGTWIDGQGNAEHLGKDDVNIRVGDYWDNGRGDRYPASWQIEVPAKALSVAVTPVLPDQELVTNVRYWEGAVDVQGESAGMRVDGRGYVELTGYAGNQ